MTLVVPKYDFKHPIFQKRREYIRYAKEHIALAELQSNVIKWEVKETVSPLKIPTVYHVHFHLKTIIGIDENQMPIYGTHHTMELTIPPRYPLEACKLYMITDVWHPNIKWDGNYKGKICGNLKNFGRTYNFYMLVLRIAEILQYKNYHAEHVPPYPEDSTVASWVIDFAEPNDIVNNKKGIIIDDSPLVLTAEEMEQENNQPTIIPNSIRLIDETETPSEPIPAEKPPQQPSGRITIKNFRKKANPKTRIKLNFNKKEE